MTCRLPPVTRWIVPLMVALWLQPAWSAPTIPDIPWLHDIYVTLANAGVEMDKAVDQALRSKQVSMVANVLFTSLAGFLFVWRFAGFAMRGFNLQALLELMFTIFYVYLLLTAYTTLIPAVGNAGRFVGDTMAKGISGAEGQATFAEAIFSMLLQLTLQPSCEGFFHCMGKAGMMAMGVTQAGDLAIVILGIVATVVETWMQWCYSIAYAVGWFTIPFLLYPRLSFLFDGWLRFFCGVIMYDLVAKITLAIVLLAFQAMQMQAPGAFGATIEVRQPFDLIALFLFIAIGVLVLCVTGTFANALVAGVAGTSGVLQDMARGAAKPFHR